jgi:His/Glu/Gln/Arg/opine family amino acid ABC transporter permease subunit
MTPLLDWEFMASVLPDLVAVLPVTLKIAAVSLVLALAVGLATALARIQRLPVLSQLAALYVSFTRGTPLLVQIYLSYYGLPKVLDHLQARWGWGLDVSGIPAIAYIYFAFTFNVGAYASETIRAAILAVDRGQLEAALSIGMTRAQAMRRIVLPQALTVALPSFGNTAIALVKDTSLAFLVSVVEVMGKAKILGARGFQFFEVYVLAALVYWAVCIAIERLVAAGELRLRRHEGARPA